MVFLQGLVQCWAGASSWILLEDCSLTSAWMHLYISEAGAWYKLWNKFYLWLQSCRLHAARDHQPPHVTPLQLLQLLHAVSASASCWIITFLQQLSIIYNLSSDQEKGAILVFTKFSDKINVVFEPHICVWPSVSCSDWFNLAPEMFQKWENVQQK